MKEKKQNGLEKLAVFGLIVILFLTVTGNIVRFIFDPIMHEVGTEIEREFSEERMQELSTEFESLGEELGTIGEELGEEFGTIGEELGEEIGSEFEQIGEEIGREFESVGQEIEAAEQELEYGR